MTRRKTSSYRGPSLSHLHQELQSAAIESVVWTENSLCWTKYFPPFHETKERKHLYPGFLQMSVHLSHDQAKLVMIYCFLHLFAPAVSKVYCGRPSLSFYYVRRLHLMMMPSDENYEKLAPNQTPSPNLVTAWPEQVCRRVLVYVTV